MKIGKHEYSRAVGAADDLVLAHKQIDRFEGDLHEAPAAAMGLLLVVRTYNLCNGLPVVCLGDTPEDLQMLSGYVFCRSVPLLLDFMYRSLIFAPKHGRFGACLFE